MRIWKEIKNYVSKFQDLTSVGIANIFAMVISSFFWLYMAVLLGEEGYGEISYLLATANIVSNFALIGSIDTLIVFRAKDEKIQSGIFLIVIIVAIIASITSYLFIESTEVSIFIFGMVIFSLVINETLGSKNYKKYSYFIITQRILTVFLALILYFIIGLEGIVLGYAIAFLPYAIFTYKIFKDVPINFHLIRTRLGFIVNSFIKSIMLTFGSYLDKLIIFPLFGAALLGNYTLGYQLFSLAAIIPGIVFQYVLPQESSGTSHTKLKKLTVIVSMILTILIIVLAPILLPILFSEFDKTILIVQIMSLALVPNAISTMLMSNLLAHEKIKKVVIGQSISLTVIIGGIFLLNEIYGIIGAAISFTLGNIVGCVYFFTIIKFQIKKRS
jgi:O-antigen/teichoic acid export membrane protein